jgi:hypothetical protein
MFLSMPEPQTPRVLRCTRVVDMPVPAARSFMSQCAHCRTPVWVSYNSPIEPTRICLVCSEQSADKA